MGFFYTLVGLIALFILLIFSLFFIVHINRKINDLSFNQSETDKEVMKLHSLLHATEKKIIDADNKIVAERNRTKFTFASNDSLLHANKMSQMGANVDELMQTCSIDKAEANLINTLSRDLGFDINKS